MSGAANRLLGWLWPQLSTKTVSAADVNAVGKQKPRPPPVVVNRTDYLFPFVVPGSSEAMLVDFTRSKDSAQREREQWQAFGDEEVLNSHHRVCEKKKKKKEKSLDRKI